MSARADSATPVTALRYVAVPVPWLGYLLQLPGDYLKVVLRLVQLANWKRAVTPNGVEVDAGEALISLRSKRFWDGVDLDRNLSEQARMAHLRRVLDRLERDGYASRRPARQSGTGSGTSRPGAGGTPATIVRFLKFRDVLWPSNSDPAHGPELAPAHGPAHGRATIQAVTTKPNPTCEGGPSSPAQPATTCGGSRQTKLDDVRALLKRVEKAFGETTGRAYQHADPRAVHDDRRAAARLLELPGSDPAAIEAVWRQAITRAEWPRIDTLADLARHWARFAPGLGPPERSGSRPRDTSKSDHCPLWVEIAAELREVVSAATFNRWFAPLRATLAEGDLIVLSPDRYHREFVNDNYRALLEERVGALVARRLEIAEGAAPSVTVRIEVDPARAVECEAAGRSSDR